VPRYTRIRFHQGRQEAYDNYFGFWVGLEALPDDIRLWVAQLQEQQAEEPYSKPVSPS
jgi:hypothetical protein